METGLLPAYSERIAPMSLSKILAELVDRSGPWITAGLIVVLLAQLWPVVPIATAILLVGFGATRLMEGRVRRGTAPAMLALLQVMAYGLLVCLAIGAQWDLALKATGGPVRPVVAVDTVLAVAGLAMMVCRTAKMAADPM